MCEDWLYRGWLQRPCSRGCAGALPALQMGALPCRRSCRRSHEPTASTRFQRAGRSSTAPQTPDVLRHEANAVTSFSVERPLQSACVFCSVFCYSGHHAPSQHPRCPLLLEPEVQATILAECRRVLLGQDDCYHALPRPSVAPSMGSDRSDRRPVRAPVQDKRQGQICRSGM